MRVLAAMSGGVDSAVAAALALEAGHEVVGVHLALAGGVLAKATTDGGPDAGIVRSLADASKAAEHLGIDFLHWDMTGEFSCRVVADFLDSYREGLTPNPCVRCNATIKFGALLHEARALGFDAVCTGHYARLGHDDAGRLALRRARDQAKDQSYVLAGVGPSALAHALTPLGQIASKAEVRAMAASLGLPVASTPESFDLCFVPDGGVRAFLASRLGSRPGPILDEEGRQVGTHLGTWLHTIGQRRGLALSAPRADGRPRYVVRIDPMANTLHVAPAQALELSGFTLANLLEYRPLVPGAPLLVQVRAHGTPLSARPYPVSDGRCRIDLDEGVRGLAPGQSAVLYFQEHVVAHGIVESTTGLGGGVASPQVSAGIVPERLAWTTAFF